MKKFIALIAVLIGVQTHAATLVETCIIKSSDISFEIKSDESMNFAQVNFFSKTNPSILLIKNDSTIYHVNYANTVLSDGAGYIQIVITEISTGKQVFNTFYRDSSYLIPGSSLAWSALSGISFKNQVETSFVCK